MSREIDERIVAMYFDNRNFEKGAQETIKTLDMLKRGMTMEGAEKGTEVVDEFAKKLDFDKVRKSAEKLKTTISGVGNVLKKAFNLGPIDNLYHALDNFKNKYFDRVLGFDIADKLAKSLENAFHGLTTAPISAGYNQYEQSMDSIKTIMSSTGESLEVVKSQLMDLTDYANQTIYSLSDMTSNIGKFTNNKVPLEDATMAMIGLANATADAGQGAQQASMAMYNVSQAIGVGKMTSIDWKSLENANIATSRLKETLIQAAEAKGTLIKKTVKNKQTGQEEIKYYTKAEKGVKEMEVSVENFRDSLSKGWLTKDSLINTFKIFSGQLSAEQIMDLGGFSREEAERLADIGREAMKAATEVRTFKKMMDALKESVQSAWATSFEFIFGDMQEGTKLWTDLNNRIDAVLSKGSEQRNQMLIEWRGMSKDENGNIRKISDIYEERKKRLDARMAEWKKAHEGEYDFGDDTKNAGERRQKIKDKEYNELLREYEELEKSLGNRDLWTDYRQVAIDAFFSIFDSVQLVLSTIKEAWTDIFGSIDSDTLKGITKGFKDFADNFKKWLGDSEDANSRINKIKKAFQGLFSVGKFVYMIFKGIFDVLVQIVKPLIDPLLDAMAKFGEWFNIGDAKNLGDAIGKISKKVSELWNKLSALGWKGVFDKISTWVNDLWVNIRDGISQWLTDNGLDGLRQWFVDVGDKLKAGYETVKSWWKGSGIPQFFSGIWDSIVGVFAPKKKQIKRIGAIEKDAIHSMAALSDDEVIYEDSPIVEFFKNLWNGVEDAYKEAKNWWEKESGIPQFFSGIWDNIMWAFTPDEEKGTNAPIVEFFKNIWNGVSDAFETAKNWWEKDSGIPQFFTELWNKVAGIFKPKKKEIKKIGMTQKKDVIHSVSEAYEGEAIYEDSPFVEFFKNLWNGVSDAFKSAKNWWDKESGIPQFFSGIWKSLIGVFEPTEEGEDSAFVAFFKNLWNGVTEAFEEAKNWWENESGIPEFFSEVWEKIAGIFTPKKKQIKDLSHLRKVDIMPILYKETDEKEFLYEEAPIVTFLKNVWNGIKDTWGEIVGWSGWAAIGKFFSDMWGWFSGLFKGDVESTGGEKVSEAVKELGEVSGILSDSDLSDGEVNQAEQKTSLLERILAAFGGFWTNLKDWFGGSEVTEVAVRFMNALGDLFVAFSVIIEHVSKLIRDVVTGNLSFAEVMELIGAISAIITLKAFFYHTKANLATIAEGTSSMGLQFLEVAAGLALLAWALTYVGQVDDETLTRGASIILSVGGVVGSIVAAIAEVTKNQAAKAASNRSETITGVERIFGKFINAFGLWGMLKIAVDSLPSIITTLSDAKENGLSGDDVFKTLLGITTTISGLMLALSIVEKISPNGIDKKATFNTVISSLEVVAGVIIAIAGGGGVLELLKNSFTRIGGEGSYQNAIDTAISFVSDVGKLIGGFIRGIVNGIMGYKTDAQRIEEASDVVKILDEFSKDFSEDRFTDIIKLADFINTVSKYTEDVEPKEFANFAEAAGYIADSLVNFSKAMSDANGNFVGLGLPDEDAYKRYESALGMVEKMSGLFGLISAFTPNNGGSIAFNEEAKYEKIFDLENAIDVFSKFSKDEQAVDEFVASINRILEKLGGISDGSNVNFDGIGIVTKLYESIKTAIENPSLDLPEFDGTPIVNAIIDGITKHEPMLGFAIRTLVQSAIDELNKGSEKLNIDVGETATSVVETVSGALENANVYGSYVNLADSGYNFVSTLIDFFTNPTKVRVKTTKEREANGNPIQGFLIDETQGVVDATGEYVAAVKQSSVEIEEANKESSEKVANAEYTFPEINTENYEQYMKELEKTMSQFGIKGFIDDEGTFNFFSEEDNPYGQLTEWMTTIQKYCEDSENNPLTITITPIISMDNFDTEMQKLREYFNGQMPLSINSALNIGEQAIPVSDHMVLDQLGAIKTQLEINKTSSEIALQRLANRVDNLGSDMRQMKLYLDGKTLVGGILGGIDAGLYRVGWYGEKTGVDVNLPHAIRN